MGPRGEAVEDVVGRSAVFGALPESLRDAVAARLVPRSVLGGDVVIREGDPADGLYLVRAGRLQVRAEVDGKVVVLDEVGRGEVVGEAALLTEKPRFATVIALRDSELLHLPVDAFEDLVAAHPPLLRPVASQVVDRMVQARSGTPGRPVATLAVVPIHPGPPAREGAWALGEALVAVGGGVAVDAGDQPSGLSDGAWAQQLEAEHPLVVFLGDGEDEEHTRRGIRQADVVVLVADVSEPKGPTRIEATLAEHRERVDVPVELVLVHPPLRELPSGTAEWLRRRSVRRHHHLRLGHSADAARAARLLTDRGVGLVLSGGGARGMAEVGVVQALRELEIPIDAVGGTSAGSLVAGAVARDWSVDRIRATLRRGMVEGRHPVDVTVPVTSLAAGRRVTERLKAAAGDSDLEDLWIDCFCVSTNLSRNAPQVHRRGRSWRAIRASMSIPGIFPPVAQDGDVLVDGGLVDNLPVAEMRRGHEGITVVAVDVGVHRGLAAGDLPDSTVVDGWRLMVDRLHPRRDSPEVAGILTVLARLTELGGGSGERAVDSGDVLVTPDVEGYPILDFTPFDDLVAEGHRAGLATLTPWWEERGRR